MPRKTALAAIALTLSGALVLLTALPASAASAPGAGVSTAPAQPYLANLNPTDWLGSYTVNGESAWPTEFALGAPDAAEPVNAPAAAVTKWSTAVGPADSSLISYLLFQYGGTTDPDTAAALAHSLYSLLSAPVGPGDLNPANDFRHIAYDAPLHLAKLSVPAQALVTSMLGTSSDLFGPWTIDLTPPAGATIGAASNWSLRVLGASGVAVPSASVQVTVTDAALAGGATTLALTTPADGSALLVPVTPSAAAPAVTVDIVSPVAVAQAVQPVAVDVTALLLRSSNVAPVSTTLAGTASAAAAGPALAATGSRTPPWPTAWGALAAVLLGGALVLIGNSPRRRRTHRLS